MYIVSLITNPQTPILDRALVESLRNAWGGGDAVWLNPAVAAEFALPAPPDNFWTVWQDLQSLRIDLCIQPEMRRKKQILIADMDSTMIEQECIDELADEAGVGPHVAGITARAMNGEIDFAGALEERVGLLKGLPVGKLDEAATRIRYMPGGATLVATMKKHGAYCALVSGGFTYFTAMVRKKLGFDFDAANVLEHDGTSLAGTVGRPILGKEAKLTTLQRLAGEHDITIADAVTVGDGANDLPMLKAAGLGVAFHAKPAVAAEVPAGINHGDLSALLYLQGYRLSDFEERKDP